MTDIEKTLAYECSCAPNPCACGDMREGWESCAEVAIDAMNETQATLGEFKRIARELISDCHVGDGRFVCPRTTAKVIKAFLAALDRAG